MDRGRAGTAIVLKDGRVLVLDGISVDDALEPDPSGFLTATLPPYGASITLSKA